MKRINKFALLALALSPLLKTEEVTFWEINGVKWNTVGRDKCKLVWRARIGEREAYATYTIDLDRCTMTKNGKNPLPVRPQECRTMHQMYDEFLTRYAAESSHWYRGGGKYRMDFPPALKANDGGTRGSR